MIQIQIGMMRDKPKIVLTKDKPDMKTSGHEGKMKLAEYQNDAVDNIISKFKTNKEVCLAFYTGSGKTNIFIDLCRKIILKNPHAKIGISSYLTTEVKMQTFERTLRFGLEKVQCVRANMPLSDIANVFIFNPQAVYKRKAEFKFDYLIIDECHAGLDEDSIMLNKIVRSFANKDTKTLFVSATPWDTLNQERYSEMPVIKRSMNEGVKDGRVADVEIFFEENQLEFKPDDFSRNGSLKDKAIESHHSVIKSMCVGKMKNIIKRYGDSIGKKVIVICPPGNSGEVARDMASEFGGHYYIQQNTYANFNSEDNLDRFKMDDSRFLFVIHKCQVGFDMPELETVIDLTMSRNIKLFVQRLGRVARSHKGLEKKYFYVADKSLGMKRLEWLMGTAIDFSCGNFEGWDTKTLKYRPLKLHSRYDFRESSVRVSEIVRSIAKTDSVKNIFILQYTEAKPPKKRTIQMAIDEAKQYPSRHELFKQNPSLYKWFRVHGHMDALESVHPKSSVYIYWNEESVIDVMKKCKSRGEFHKEYPGASGWILAHSRQDLTKKYLPDSYNEKWVHKTIVDTLSTFKSWSDIRRYPGLRGAISKTGKTQEYKAIFMNMVPGGEVTDGPHRPKRLRVVSSKPKVTNGESRKEFYARLRKISLEKRGKHEKRSA
jgi:superfamily II DNA or RNA helicase